MPQTALSHYHYFIMFLRLRRFCTWILLKRSCRWVILLIFGTTDRRSIVARKFQFSRLEQLFRVENPQLLRSKPTQSYAKNYKFSASLIIHNGTSRRTYLMQFQRTHGNQRATPISAKRKSRSNKLRLDIGNLAKTTGHIWQAGWQEINVRA